MRGPVQGVALASDLAGGSWLTMALSWVPPSDPRATMPVCAVQEKASLLPPWRSVGEPVGLLRRLSGREGLIADASLSPPPSVPRWVIPAPRVQENACESPVAVLLLPAIWPPALITAKSVSSPPSVPRSVMPAPQVVEGVEGTRGCGADTGYLATSVDRIGFADGAAECPGRPMPPLCDHENACSWPDDVDIADHLPMEIDRDGPAVISAEIPRSTIQQADVHENA